MDQLLRRVSDNPLGFLSREFDIVVSGNCLSHTSSQEVASFGEHE